MAILYMVATPIGNLEDITLRAVRILGEVDTIACEDTRHTLGMLTHLGIRKSLIACHAQDEAKGSARILGLLNQGKNVAYCSDAGTPGLSDPGIMAAAMAREAGHDVVPLPGASALTALVSAAGMYSKGFTFDGFLSPKAGRRRSRLKVLMARAEAFVLYESPYRIQKLLEDIAAIDPDRQLCAGRELTKLHEEFLCGTAATVLGDLNGRASVKGEFAVLVAGSPEKFSRDGSEAGSAESDDEEN
ncbi:MAG TPA: 16S rRNA (cytidine(1402)-2'-O)-methyltransferase [Spirochaetales bacterium]|nr:16S rRNA (cytidine(1402)-2'-O)-methyltransferase [Spirochaetales bacterium]